MSEHQSQTGSTESVRHSSSPADFDSGKPAVGVWTGGQEARAEDATGQAEDRGGEAVDDIKDLNWLTTILIMYRLFVSYLFKTLLEHYCMIIIINKFIIA